MKRDLAPLARTRWLLLAYAMFLGALAGTGCHGSDAMAYERRVDERPQLTPEQAWHEVQRAGGSSDTALVWSCLSSESQRWLINGTPAARLRRVQNQSDEALADLARESGVKPAQLRAMSVPDLARLTVLLEMRRNRARMLAARWKGADVVGHTAVLTLATPAGDEERVVMVDEGGTWKLDLQATWRLRRLAEARA